MSADGRVLDLSYATLKRLGLPDAAIEILLKIRAELDADYRERFVEMATAVREQAEALSRIQSTLGVLVRHLEPRLEGMEKAAFRIASDGEEADVASAMAVPDPLRFGYRLTQQDVANALRIPASTVSVLVRAWGLHEDAELAVRVRDGTRPLFAYHSRIVEEIATSIHQNRPVPDKNRSSLRSARRILRLPD